MIAINAQLLAPSPRLGMLPISLFMQIISCMQGVLIMMQRCDDSLNYYLYSKGQGVKAPPPANIFRSNAKHNDTVRTCKERTAKCEIKSNHLESLLCKYYSWDHGSVFEFINNMSVFINKIEDQKFHPISYLTLKFWWEVRMPRPCATMFL